MPEKGEELYKILKADPNYEGVGSDYNKFKEFFSDEKNYTNLYNTLKADPNYEGIGKDANAFSEFFGLKKKEQTIPFDGQKFGGKKEEPLLPLTSSTVSPSASKQPKSTTPFASIGGKLPKEEIQVEKPISTQAIDNRDLALTVESRDERKNYLGKVSEGILSSIKQNPDLYLSQKDKPTMYGEKIIPAGTPNVDNISKAVDLYAEKIKKETGRELSTFDKQNVLQNTLNSIKSESQARNAAMLTNLQFQSKKKLPLIAITGVKTVGGEVVKESVFKENLQKIEQEELSRLEKLSKTPDKQIDAEFKPEIDGLKSEVESAANVLKQESQEFFASQFEQTQQQIYNQYDELVKSGQMSADVANVEMKQKLDEYQVQLEIDTNAIYEPRLNELKKDLEAKQKDIQTRYNRRVKARFDSEKEKASKRIQEEISKYEDALPKGYMEEYQAAFKKNLDNEINLEGLKKINEFSNLGNFEKMQTAIMAGMGDVASTIGGSLSYVGVNTGNLQNWVAQSGLYNELPVFNDDNIFENLTNTDWWIANGVRSIPFTVATMPIGVAGGTGAGLLASALGAGKRAQVIASVVGGGFAGWEVERFLEQGAGFNDAINEGKSVSEAAEIAAAIGKYNYSTLPMNMLQMLPVFSKSFKFLGSAGIEAGAGAFEEINQGWAQAKAKAQSEGQDVSYLDYATSPQAIQEGAIGSAMSQGFTLFSLKNTPEVDKQINTLMTSIGIGGESQALEVLKTMRNNGAIDEKQFEEATNLLNYTLNAISQTENINVDDNVKSALVNRFVAIEKAKELLTENENDLASQAAKELIADKENEIKNILKGSEPVYLIKITGNDIPVVSTKEEVESILNNKLILPLLEIEVYNDNKTKASVEGVYAKKAATEIKTDESEISQEATPKGDTGVEVTEPVIEEGKEQVEIEETPIKEQETIAEASDSKGVYLKDGEYGVLRTDGQTVVFETNDKIFDLGNKDELSDVSIAEFGIEKEEPLNIQVNQDNSIVIDGVRFVNNFSEPQAAINTDADGNVISVNLETEDGKKRTFRGQRAEEIAYQYKLREFEQNATEESIARLEQEVTSIEGKAEKAKSETKKRSAAKRKSETIKTKEDAVQEQTAGQVPVQPETEVSEGVEGGKPKAEPKEATEESKVEEIGTGLLNFLGIPSEVSAEGEVKFSKVSTEKINWSESKIGRGDRAITERNDNVKNAAEDLYQGRIGLDEYNEIVEANSPIKPITEFIEPAAEKDIRVAVGDKSEGKINLNFPEGKKVGLRLDIPAYINKNIWAITVHEDGKTGSPLSYNNVARIKNVEFTSDPKVALDIARQKELSSGGKMGKATIARMMGEWMPIDGNNGEAKGKSAMKMIDDIKNNPAWSQIGMNPFRHSYFYDRATGLPVVAAEEVIQIGGLVYAKNAETTSKNDERFIVKDKNGNPIIGKEGEVLKFSKGKESDKVLLSETEKEKQVIDQMNKMNLVNEGIDLVAPSTTEEEIDIDELNSRLDNPLKTIEWTDYEGIPFTFTISDQLRTGNAVNPNTGETITNLKGGLGFNGTKGNENNAWANTTKDEAEEMLQRAKDVYTNNKPLFDKLWKEGKLPNGYIPMAVVKMAETSILSNEAVFRVGIQNIETLPKTNRKKAVSELAKSMQAKINKESTSLKRGVDKNGKPYTENTIKLKKKGINQYQKILDSINNNKYDDIVDVLKDKDNFSLPEKSLIANEVFYGSPTPIGGKEIDISRSRPNTPVSKVLLGGKSPSLINLGKITDLLTEPSMKNVPNMHIVSIVGVDVNAKNVNKINHPNYPFGVKGVSIGVLKNPVHMKDAFGEAYGSALGQVVKNEAANASVSVKSALTQGIPVQSGLPNRVFKSAIARGELDAVDKLAGFLRQAFPSTTFFTSNEAWDAAMADPSIKKKLKDGDVVYAFTTDGNIFINPSLKTTKATLHETGHIWMSFVKENNPKLHAKGLSLVDGTKEYKKAKEQYGDTELAREEALMELMSSKGDTIVNAAQKAKFKEWLLSVYKYIANNFKSLLGLSPKEIENLTLDKFLEGMLADVLSGKELTTKKIKDKVKFSLESQNDKIKEYIDSQRKAGQTDKNIRAGIETVADKLGLSALDIDNLMNAEKIENSKKAFEFWLNLGTNNNKFVVSTKMKSEAAKAGIDEKALKNAAKTMKNIDEIRKKLLDAKVIETIDCKWG